MSNPILNRLNPTNTIKDTIPGQGQPLICLATISMANLPGYYFVNTTTDGSGNTVTTNITYNELNKSYANGTLVFNSYGSLTDIKNYLTLTLSQFFISPFDPAYTNAKQPLNYNQYSYISPPTPGSTLAVINGADNAFVYGLVQQIPSANSLPGSTFVSPENSKWILNVSTDNKNNNVYKIFFNPLQNSNISSSDISSNLPSFCDIVSNADPMCFCGTNNDICTKAAFSAQNTDGISQDNINSVSKNCGCLNNACRFAMANQNNNYVNGMPPCGKTSSACGNNFSYSNTYGVSSSSGDTVFTACGGTASSSGSGSGSGSDSGSGKPMGTAAKLGITFSIIFLILMVAYFMM